MNYFNDEILIFVITNQLKTLNEKELKQIYKKIRKWKNNLRKLQT